TSKTFTVTINPDAVREPGNEIFFANLSNPVGATLIKAQAVGTIVDDDQVPTVAVGDAMIREGDTGTTDVTVPVFLSFPAPNDTAASLPTVDGTAVNGADYASPTTTSPLTITAGTTQADITIPIIGNRAWSVAAFKDFTVQLTSVTTANAVISATKSTGTV